MTTLQKFPENIAASHHLSQACRFPRAAQEMLQHRSWVTACQQTFPQLPQAVCLLQTSFGSRWGRTSSLAVKYFLGGTAPAVWGAGTQSATKAVLSCNSTRPVQS